MTGKFGDLFAFAPCPVERVLNFWLFNSRANYQDHCCSPPGHLAHFFLTAGAVIKIGARFYEPAPGDVLFYQPREKHVFLTGPTPVKFYSIAFRAPSLTPPTPENRLRSLPPEFQARFEAAYAAFSGRRAIDDVFQVYALLMDILLETKAFRSSEPLPSERTLWRQVESLALEQKIFRPKLSELARLGGRGASAVIKSCRKIHGVGPMKRFRELRLKEAKMLLRNSTLSVSMVAEYLGYPRVHEFSREFSRGVGAPPLKYRAADSDES